MISHPLWRFKLISGYISSLLQDFCVYRSRPKTDRSVRSNLIHGPTNGPIDRSGPIPSQKSSVLCIGLDRGPDWTEVVHPCADVYIELMATGYTAKKEHGSSLKLLSVGLLDDGTAGYNFESPSKKRKMQ